MRALKTIVITLGVLVIGGFGLLVYGLSQNWHRLSTPPLPPDLRLIAGAKAPVPTWGHVGLGQPADSRIQSVTQAGNLVVLQIVSGGDERLVVLDPASGAVVGTFEVTDKP
ncbi:MAG: hypothetical protein JO128_12285 [Alphaproteobacteria bacterium]|nr:hypothetical protein [Alphaproteobacteria bacterium]